MKPVLIAYATREGHTRDVADRVAVTLNELGRPAVLLDVQQLDRAIVLEDFSGAILAASVHAGAHEDAMVDFVKTNRDAFAVRPTAFLSVSLTEATAEDPDRTAEERAEAAGRSRRPWRSSSTRLAGDLRRSNRWRGPCCSEEWGA